MIVRYGNTILSKDGFVCRDDSLGDGLIPPFDSNTPPSGYGFTNYSDDHPATPAPTAYMAIDGLGTTSWNETGLGNGFRVVLVIELPTTAELHEWRLTWRFLTSNVGGPNFTLYSGNYMLGEEVYIDAFSTATGDEGNIITTTKKLNMGYSSDTYSLVASNPHSTTSLGISLYEWQIYQKLT